VGAKSKAAQKARIYSLSPTSLAKAQFFTPRSAAKQRCLQGERKLNNYDFTEDDTWCK